MTRQIQTSVPDETKAQAFVRVAPKRVAKILHAVEILEKCAGSGYEYTPQQVSKIFDAITKRLTDARITFDASKKEKVSAPSFTL